MVAQDQVNNFKAKVNTLWLNSHMQGRPPECWLAKLHRLNMVGVDISDFRPSSAQVLAGISDPLAETLLSDPSAELAYKAWLEDLHWANMQRLNKRAGQKMASERRKQPSKDIVEAYKEAHGWDDKFKHFKNQAAKIPEPSAMQIAGWCLTQVKYAKTDKPNLLKRLRRLKDIK